MESHQVREVRSGQVRSGQVRSGQVRSGQVRSGQVKVKRRKRNVNKEKKETFLTTRIYVLTEKLQIQTKM